MSEIDVEHKFEIASNDTLYWNQASNKIKPNIRGFDYEN